MVQGIPELHRRFGRVAAKIKRQLRPELAAAAERIVGMMRRLRPAPEIQIEWVWGPPPSGVISIGQVKAALEDRDFISIYATASTSEYPAGFPAVARWFEFGTFQRYHRSGKATGAIAAQPYFYPAYRANRKAVRSRIAKKLKQATKSL
jgi:hypothetical protein